jgi:hypothetical protein
MKKQFINSALAGLLAVSATGFTAHAGDDTNTAKPSTGIRAKLENKLISSKLMQAQLESPKFDLFGLVGFTAGYMYDVVPAYTGGLFSRYDKFYIRAEVIKNRVLTAAEASNFSTGLNLTQTGEVQFVRQYKDALEASDAIPYFAKNIPDDSETAIKNLNEGDYFSMKFPMNLIVSGNFFQQLASKMILTAEGHYLLGGEFQVHVLRLPDNHIRLKIIGLKRKEKGGSVGAHVAGVVDFLKFDYLNKKLLERLDLKAEYVYNNGENNVFMVDYTLNLNDAKAAAAYDKVFQHANNQIELWASLDPRNIAGNFRKPMMLDIEAIDQIARQGEEQKAANRDFKPAVRRAFKGSLDSDYYRHQLNVKLGIVRMTEQKECSDNRVKSYKLKGSAEDAMYYNLKTCHLLSDNHSILSWLNVTKINRQSTVYSTDSKFENKTPDDLIFAYEKHDTKFKRRDFEDTQGDLKRMVPQSIFNSINFTNWKNEKTSSVGVYAALVIHPEAILTAPTRSQKEVAALYDTYLKQFDMAEIAGKLSLNKNSEQSPEDYQRIINGYKSQIVKAISDALDRSGSPAARFESLEVLQKNSLFALTGIRFLVELFDQSQLEKNIRFDLAMNSTEEKIADIKSSFGNKREGAIYDTIMLALSLINNDGYDLRLESETLLKDRMTKK